MPFHWISDELRKLEAQGLLRTRRTVTPLPGGRCLIDGHELWNFAANDYLGLAGDPEVIQAAIEASGAGGGARASALISGRTPWHTQLEAALAEFEGTAAALLFPSGFAANSGTLAALVGAEDVIFCDRQNHASLVDGCRASGARFRVYRREDLNRLADELQKSRGARRRLIVTDSIFSMDGAAAPLPELVTLARDFQAMLLVDEAHGTGVYGRTGRGWVEECGLESAPQILRIGTLSKALGAQGGFVPGDQSLVDWLWNRARTQIYSTALAPAACGAALAALAILRRQPQRGGVVREKARRLRSLLRAGGITPLGRDDCPIIPVVVRDDESRSAANSDTAPVGRLNSHAAVRLAAALEQLGYFVAAVRPPTVPHSTSRLRITVSTAHPDAAIDALAAAVLALVSDARRDAATAAVTPLLRAEPPSAVERQDDRSGVCREAVKPGQSAADAPDPPRFADDWQPTASLETLRLRAQLTARVRSFFDSCGYVEVETPLLSHDVCVDAWIDPFHVSLEVPGAVAAGGAVADAADKAGSRWGPMFLQTSPEFAMKRLLVAGAPAIYQITRSFRRGEAGQRHNPEFTLLEWYRPGDDHHAQMTFTQALVEAVLQSCPPDRVPAGVAACLAQPWPRLSYEDAFQRYTGIAPLLATPEELRALAQVRSVAVPASLALDDRDGLLNLLLAELVEPGLATLGAVFLYDYPASQAALAKTRTVQCADGRTACVAERFELYLDGIEICNGYHELQDSAELYQRMRRHSELRVAHGKEALPAESRLTAAQRAGLPPCAGVALGFDRLMMWLLQTPRIADVTAFPFDRA